MGKRNKCRQNSSLSLAEGRPCPLDRTYPSLAGGKGVSNWPSIPNPTSCVRPCQRCTGPLLILIHLSISSLCLKYVYVMAVADTHRGRLPHSSRHQTLVNTDMDPGIRSVYRHERWHTGAYAQLQLRRLSHAILCLTSFVFFSLVSLPPY